MKTRICILMLLAAAMASAFGAGLSVPDFRILTNGRVNNGALVLSSRVYTDLLIEGGAKFSASFKLGFQTDDLESYLNALATPITATTISDEAIAILNDRTGLMFRSAAITLNGAFGTSLETTVFVGRLDPFASGDDFPLLFGTTDFATRLRGYMYYPDGIGNDQTRYYNGLHEAYGTGLRLSLPGERLKPYLYFYQDAWIGPGNYSVDARLLLNTENIKLEGFAGASSYPGTDLGVYRGGFLFFFDTGNVGAFYAQIGVPRWDPTQPFGMDMLFFMFEPRVDFGAGTLTLSLFFHPAWYLQKETKESGALDMRVDFSLGKLAVSGLQAGVEALLSYDPNDANDPTANSALVVEIAPYFNSIRDGVRWDLKLGIRALPFPEEAWYGIFRPSIGITTAF
jgi:hypothetical protein